MPPDAPTFLPVPLYASQYLRVATQTSEALSLNPSISGYHSPTTPSDLTAPGARPDDFLACGLPQHNLWSSLHHLRSFLGSVTQTSGDSEFRHFGDSEIRWFGGLQPPPNNLRRNHGSFDLGPLSLIPAPTSTSPWPVHGQAQFTSSPGCWPRSGELLARFAYSGSCAEGPPAVRRFGGSEVRRFAATTELPPEPLAQLHQPFQPSAQAPQLPGFLGAVAAGSRSWPLGSRALNLDPQTRPHDPEGTSGFLGVAGQFRSLGTSALGASAISAFGDFPRRFRRFGGSQPQSDNLRSPQHFGVLGPCLLFPAN
ncbi:hypothetical protein GGX14DRAFT_397341 [Mycena pura]|uniref:Uncharacterized protein n=1 Tax=Mycena pura TaxID=153505 RepID=A0AAD6V8W2_9AGAR|nr:hypothetical protein GGX14DRAFT_397341 [Mycena pura]